MPALTLTADQLQAGDVLTGYTAAGRAFTLPERRAIEGTRRPEDGAVRLVRPGPNPHGVTWWIYPDQADAWTVEREPAGDPCDRCGARAGSHLRGPRWLCSPCESAEGLEAGRQAERARQTAAELEAEEAAAEIRGTVWVPADHPRRRDVLARLSSLGKAGEYGRQLATFATVGDAVMILDGTRARAGLVVESSRHRLRVEYVTPTGAEHWRRGRIGRTFRPWVRREDARVIVRDSWAGRSARRVLAGPQD